MCYNFEMKNNQKGFVAPLIISIITLLAIGGGVYIYKIKKVETTSTTTNSSNSSCKDFDKFSDFILKTIEKSDAQGNPEKEGALRYFTWKKDENKPSTSYPVLKLAIAYYGISSISDMWDISEKARNTDFMLAIKKSSILISQNIYKETKKLNLESDTLNTSPFISSDLDTSAFEGAGLTIKDFSYNQTFAFKNNTDLYRVDLFAEQNYQAPGYGSVIITCGESVENYDKLYNALIQQLNYHDGVLIILSISPDNKIYQVWDSKHIPQYYYFDGYTTKLVSTATSGSIIECSILEKLKLGKGMDCIIDTGSEYIHRKVTY